MVPVISSTYRYGTNTTAWRAWDDEIIGIDTTGGIGGIVYRFAHHRSNVGSDANPAQPYFWYEPIANVSPDGCRVEHPNQVPARPRVLDRDDGVGTARDRRPRRDLHRLTHADGGVGPLADHRAPDHLELGRRVGRGVGDIGRADREAVHPARRELREVDRRGDGGGGHTAVRIGQRKLQRRQRVDLRQDRFASHVEGNQPVRRVVIVERSGHARSLSVRWL